MIEGKFLVCDDLGPLGRLVPPGKLLAMDPVDLNMVVTERRWVGQQYEHAEARAEGFRKALRTAHQGGEAKREKVRESFEVWTIEAAKYALCDHWLLQVIGRLESGQPMAMDVPKDFFWDGYAPLMAMKDRLFEAEDNEITAGARFRA